MFPFLVIISLIAAAYAFWTKQTKVGLGYIVYTLTFFLLIPNLTNGIKSNFLEALALVLFVVGSIIVVFKRTKKDKTESKPEQAEEPKQDVNG